MNLKFFRENKCQKLNRLIIRQFFAKFFNRDTNLHLHCFYRNIEPVSNFGIFEFFEAAQYKYFAAFLR